MMASSFTLLNLQDMSYSFENLTHSVNTCTCPTFFSSFLGLVNWRGKDLVGKRIKGERPGGEKTKRGRKDLSPIHQLNAALLRSLISDCGYIRILVGIVIPSTDDEVKRVFNPRINCYGSWRAFTWIRDSNP